MPRIAFLTSGHQPFDDRIFFHFALTLNDFSPVIISSTIDLKTTKNNVIIDCFNGELIPKTEKIRIFKDLLIKHNPDIIICSEPLTILAANKYKKKRSDIKIIYDVTEWYPSVKQLENKSVLKRITTFCTLTIFNIISSFNADMFIFGEYYKKIPYRILFPFKKYETITYYPDLKYLQTTEPRDLRKSICLGYTGCISKRKGINNFFEVIKELKRQKTDLEIKVKIIGYFNNSTDQENYYNIIKNLNDIKIELVNYVPFENFCKEIQDMDICFDLRETGIETTHCLPIKIFFYAGCGKPVIYSDLKAIRKEVEINNFGYLVRPTDSSKTVQYIIRYIDNPEIYKNHRNEALRLIQEKYNWGVLSPKLIKFVSDTVAK